MRPCRGERARALPRRQSVVIDVEIEAPAGGRIYDKPITGERLIRIPCEIPADLRERYAGTGRRGRMGRDPCEGSTKPAWADPSVACEVGKVVSLAHHRRVRAQQRGCLPIVP